MNQLQSDNTTGVTHILREKVRAAKLRKHIEDKGEKCWYCGSGWIGSFVPTIHESEDIMVRRMYCHQCGKKWKNIYKLIDVDLKSSIDTHEIGRIE